MFKDNRVEDFRHELELFLNHLEKGLKSQRPRKFITSVVADFKKIIDQYNKTFPQNIWANSDAKIYEMIDKYCYKGTLVCPICSATLERRTSKNGKIFLGCTKFPVCKGCRNLRGRPTINDAMMSFLTRMHDEDLEEQEQNSNNRFRNLDL